MSIVNNLDIQKNYTSSYFCDKHQSLKDQLHSWYHQCEDSCVESNVLDGLVLRAICSISYYYKETNSNAVIQGLLTKKIDCTPFYHDILSEDRVVQMMSCYTTFDLYAIFEMFKNIRKEQSNTALARMQKMLEARAVRFGKK